MEEFPVANLQTSQEEEEKLSLPLDVQNVVAELSFSHLVAVQWFVNTHLPWVA